MCAKTKVLSAILTAAVLLLVASPARSATPEEIENAVNAGIAWLVSNQNVTDGSWGTGEQVAQTGLAVVKLQDRARELGTSEYDDEIQDGLDYIFGQATVEPYGAGSGICWSVGNHESYSTGIAMMAIANDGDLSQTVAGGPLNGMTYEQVLEGSVAFFAFSQDPDGGWRYVNWPGQESDQSNTGYAVLGLSYAKDAGITIPASIETGLNNWVNTIQDPVNGDSDDGGSWYTPTWSWVNVLKTGNLIFEMSFLGIGSGDARFDAAIAYIERHWQDTNMDPGWGYNFSGNNYQAMYCLMKGLQSSGVDLIDTDGDGDSDDDWFNQEPPASPPQDLASVIVATQNGDGSWTDNYWGSGSETLGTTWALLTLEKVTVVHKVTVAVDIKPQSCPNPLNVKSQGLLPVAILGTEDFDVQNISWATLDGVPPVKVSYEDVATPVGEDADECECTDAGPDGFIDLVLHFDTQEIVAGLGGPSDGQVMPLAVVGELLDGTDIEGEDCVVIRNKTK